MRNEQCHRNNMESYGSESMLLANAFYWFSLDVAKMTFLHGYDYTEKPIFIHFPLLCLSVIGTASAAFLSILAAVILGVCLKWKLIHLKKITLGGCGIEFQRSQREGRHILEETVLSDIRSDSTTVSNQNELNQQQTTATVESTTSSQLIVEEPIETSTPVSSRTRRQLQLKK